LRECRAAVVLPAGQLQCHQVLHLRPFGASASVGALGRRHQGTRRRIRNPQGQRIDVGFSVGTLADPRQGGRRTAGRAMAEQGAHAKDGRDAPPAAWSGGCAGNGATAHTARRRPLNEDG
jgi:hypothetical protein